MDGVRERGDQALGRSILLHERYLGPHLIGAGNITPAHEPSKSGGRAKNCRRASQDAAKCIMGTTDHPWLPQLERPKECNRLRSTGHHTLTPQRDHADLIAGMVLLPDSP
jgi:hypothetical protein